MKILINEEKLNYYMKKNNIKTYKQLCRECGINLNTFYCTKSKNRISKETFWLLADGLNCHIEELQIIDWTI